jgi:hypothetical protein
MAVRGAPTAMGALLLLLLYEVRSSPSNGRQWCAGPQGGHNTSSFGQCAGGLNASGGFYPLPKATRHPVMFVPSMIGSSLYRKLHNSNEPYPICPNGGYFGGGGDWCVRWRLSNGEKRRTPLSLSTVVVAVLLLLLQHPRAPAAVDLLRAPRTRRYRMWPPTGIETLSADPNCKSPSASITDLTCLTSMSDFIPMYADCWANDLTLVYDRATDTYNDQRGITTVANGSLDVVAWQGDPADAPHDITGKPTFGIPEYKCLAGAPVFPSPFNSWKPRSVCVLTAGTFRSAGVLDAAGYERGTEYDSIGWDWRKAPGDWMAPGAEKTPFLAPFLYSKRSFYQDRL